MSDLDSFAFEPGQQVQCKTRFDDVFKGEVVAFDLNTKVLILKSPTSAPSSQNNSTSSTTNSNHDLHCLVLDSVSEVEILGEPQADKSNNVLPNLGTKYLDTKRAAAYSERLRLVEAVGNGVSQDGISLYIAFSKKYDKEKEVTWKDKNKIVIMNSVVISPPYKESDCEPLSSKTPKEEVTYVKSNVKKFWEK